MESEKRCFLFLRECFQDSLSAFLHAQFAPSGCTPCCRALGRPSLRLAGAALRGRILTHSKATFLSGALGPKLVLSPISAPSSVLMQISYFFIGLEKLKMANI